MNDIRAWIPVGELADGFSPESNILPSSYDLVGRAIGLQFEDGTVFTLRIDREGEGQIIELEDGDHRPVRVTSLREQLYFIDYVPQDHASDSATFLLDLASGAVLQVFGTLPNAGETAASLLTRAASGQPLTAVKVQFRAGRTIGSEGDYGFPRTVELVGKRVRYRYSKTELYEHIYLNEAFYSWHCLSGVEAGLADTDLCHYFKLRDNLYLFIWQEKIVPTLGIVTVDLARNKTDGKIIGFAGYTPGELSNFSIGATASFANYTPPPAQD